MELSDAKTTLSSRVVDGGMRTDGDDWISFMNELERKLFLTNMVIMITSLVFNACVIYFICGQKKSRTTPNVTMVSICVSDILLCLFVMPTYIAMARHRGLETPENFAPFLCKFNRYIWYWCKSVIVYSVLAMACDRYAKFFKPHQTDSMSGRFIFFLSFIWFFSAAYNIWEIILSFSKTVLIQDLNRQGSEVNVSFRICVTTGRYQYLDDGFLVIDLVVLFLLPVCVIITLYGIVCHRVLKPDERMNRPRVVAKRRVILSVLLLLLFILCQLPHEVVEILRHIEGPHHKYIIVVSQVVETISFSQGILNIVAYICCSDEVNKVLGKMCVCHLAERVPSADTDSVPDVVVTAETDIDCLTTVRSDALQPISRITDFQQRKGM